jgi:nucleoside-diphosphate-sugar epimerase
MKHVLVTGACGNIGANVVDLLLERGYSVRAVDLDTPTGRKSAARWGERVDLRFGSICNEALVDEIVAGIDQVIHLAAMVPPGTDVDQATGYAVNVVATRSLIRAC